MAAVLFQLTTEDKPYLGAFKAQLQIAGVGGALNDSNPDTLTEVIIRAKEKNCTAVATNNVALLKLLLRENGTNLGRRQAHIDDYAGSIIEVKGVEFLILNPLEQLFSVPEGKFIFQRYVKKLAKPRDWLVIPPFSWEVFNPAEIEKYEQWLGASSFMAVDIETLREQRQIKCISFSFVSINTERNSYDVRTVVVPFDDEFNIAFVAAILDTAVPKVFQNGKYDNAYLLRWGCPVTNWVGDTLNAFHSWYCELPKDLGYLTSFLIRKWQYWKNESNTTNLMEYYAYNAKDTFTTAIDWLALMREMPAWAWNNYYQEFPLVFPCILAEMTGIARDNEAAEKELERFEMQLEGRLEKLRAMTATPAFNPSSPKQVQRLFYVLGSGDLKKTDKVGMEKFRNRHPLNNIIGEEIKEFREDRKMITSYLKDWDRDTNDTKTWYGRILFALNPHGTDTGRLASRESAFWCGWQIQNWPRDRDDIELKRTAIADNEFLFGEGDYEQAEARDTAYLSGDTNLIKAVDDKSRDFHGTNASAFFGLPYEEIVNSILGGDGTYIHKTINKGIRDLSKRTNHGANYNMGEQVMLDTMGLKNVLRAQALLKLPRQWSPLKVCSYLLERFDTTYPVIRDTKRGWYAKVIADVKNTGMLVGPTGWTRYCFGNPASNKRDLNRYVAHPPQSLNAMMLSKAYNNVYQNIWRPHHKIFKLGPQIHDSILYQYHHKEPWLVEEVRKQMEVPVEVTDIFGIKRTLVVPVGMKSGAERWSEIK